MTDDEIRKAMQEMEEIARSVADAYARLLDEAQKAAYVFGNASKQMAEAAESLAKGRKDTAE